MAGHTQGVLERSHHQQHETPEIERDGEELPRMSPGVGCDSTAKGNKVIYIHTCIYFKNLVLTFLTHVVVFVLQSLQRESNGINMSPALNSRPSFVTLTM